MSQQTKQIGDIQLDLHSLIIYDGVCMVCDSFVDFIMKQDTTSHFKFTGLESDIGKMVRAENPQISSLTDSILVLDTDGLHTHSTAVLRIFKKCKSLKILYYFGSIIPKFIRDYAYKLFAKYRYRLFGKKHVCMLPSQEMKSRIV